MDYLSLWNTLAGCFPLLAAARAKPPKAAPGVSGPGAGQRHPPINVFDFEALARRRLSRMAFEYVDAGAGDEITLRRNRECLDGLRLQPRVLVGAEKIDTTVELFGERLASPLLLAPCAYQKVLHPEGELATARAAAAAQTTMVVSTFATVSLEQIAGAAPARRWFQLYVQPDHGFTRELVQRAEAAGYQVLVITVDTPMLGVRDRERRSGFRLPAGIERANLKPLGKRLARLGHFEGGGDYYLLDPAICWKTIDWILSFTKLPVALKGILAPEDARLACERGVAGVVVSNHGGRNLDTVPATIEALPAVVEAVADRVPVLFDSGIRRGTDIVKALACGAKAVLIGRPYLWGLGVGGAQGVEQVIGILRAELEATMMLCGTPSIPQITRRVLWPQ